MDKKVQNTKQKLFCFVEDQRKNFISREIHGCIINTVGGDRPNIQGVSVRGQGGHLDWSIYLCGHVDFPSYYFINRFIIEFLFLILLTGPIRQNKFW